MLYYPYPKQWMKQECNSSSDSKSKWKQSEKSKSKIVDIKFKKNGLIIRMSRSVEMSLTLRNTNSSWHRKVRKMRKLGRYLTKSKSRVSSRQ